jgi:hypothetical protein
VHEDVPRADGAPDVLGALERVDGIRMARTIRQTRQVDGVVELGKVGEGDEPLRLVQILDDVGDLEVVLAGERVPRSQQRRLSDGRPVVGVLLVELPEQARILGRK